MNADGPVRVLVLPDPSWSDRDFVLETLERSRHPAVDVTSPLESKAVCAAIMRADVEPPLVIVAHGDACRLLPAVALSLRTQHRPTAGYVVVDPDAPPSTDTWPEAPVMVVSTTEHSGTSLRGWPIVSAMGGVSEAVAQCVARLIDG